jgi:5'(3')-deoxyribonucleotidase
MIKQNGAPAFAVDIDNVLAKAEKEVQRLYLDVTGTLWPRSIYASAGGLDSSTLNPDIVERIFSSFHEESIPHLPVVPGAKLALQILQLRYRIVIITARRPTSRPQTLNWLHANHIHFDELYHAEEKTEIPERIVLAVDDHPVHVTGYCELGARVFLMDQPWNRSITHPLMTRVNGWDELLQVLHYGSIQAWPSKIRESPSLHALFQPSLPAR